MLYSEDNPLAIIEAKEENGAFLTAKGEGFIKAEKIKSETRIPRQNN